MTEPQKEWRVVPNRDNDRRTFFVGNEKDARAFVESNFPRAHAQPGTDYGPEGPDADVKLVSPDGGVSTFNSVWNDPESDDEFANENDDEFVDVENDEFVDDDDDEYVRVRRDDPRFANENPGVFDANQRTE